MRFAFVPVLVVTLLPFISMPRALFGQAVVDDKQQQAKNRVAASDEGKPRLEIAQTQRLDESLIPTENLLNGFIDDQKINIALQQRGMLLRDREGSVTAKTLMDQLRSVGDRIDSPPATVEASPEGSELERCFQSTLIMANLYDCGRCDKVHVGTAGAVALSADGLVLTNYHVMNSPNDTFNYFIMSTDGRVFPVIEVLATNKLDDWAIVRVEADDLTPVRIAEEIPAPMDPLFVISHPHDHYYSVSTGVVSRFSRRPNRQGQYLNMMEITAKFSQGSSGSGVFNEAGELIGLVSRKEPIFSAPKNGGAREQNITIFKTVPLTDIRRAVGLDE